ncbi:hypothetical protein MAR_014792 [Mya arenaria]|uniref:Uncharacterized protein n=1 Tax=Mya arenaria TaxID=6604 RepID=A0ABY7FF48_MYAAR|nr:hypothetical protein MAR_014792 [Mya arenaria]
METVVGCLKKTPRLTCHWGGTLSQNVGRHDNGHRLNPHFRCCLEFGRPDEFLTGRRKYHGSGLVGVKCK